MKNRCSLEEALEGRRVFLVFHWDADGVATAAIVTRHLVGLGGVVEAAATPRIGSYSWTAIPKPPPGAELVAVLDYGIPGADYDRYASETGKPLLVIDHHRVEPPPPRDRVTYCNPVAEGMGGEEEYPSASMLAATLLGRRWSGDLLLAALGAVGDLAPFYDAGRPHPGLEAAMAYARQAGVELRQLRDLADRLDSCYRLLWGDCLVHAAREAALNPYTLLDDHRLLEAQKRSRKLLEEAFAALSPAGRVCGFEAYTLAMDALVTSAVGRRLAASRPHDVVTLVHHIPSRRGGYVYVRGLSADLSWLHREARRRGLRAGGKTNVAVLEYSGDGPQEGLRLLEELCSGRR